MNVIKYLDNYTYFIYWRHPLDIHRQLDCKSVGKGAAPKSESPRGSCQRALSVAFFAPGYRSKIVYNIPLEIFIYKNLSTAS